MRKQRGDRRSKWNRRYRGTEERVTVCRYGKKQGPDGRSGEEHRVGSKTALVLGGGGSRGSYELGVWQALREMKIGIDIVTGTSIGAINGAMIAQGDYETAVSLWNHIETSQVIDIPLKEDEPLNKKVIQTYQNFALNFVKSGGTDTGPLIQTLRAVIDEDKVRSSTIDYGLVTVEMGTGAAHELFREDIPRGKLIDYMVASASIYPAFKPYRIGDVRYLDGAYHDNLPVKMAVKKGADHVIAVDLEAFGVVKKEMLELIPHVTYIRCYWNLGPTLVFDLPTMRRNIRWGYLDTLKAFHVYEGYAFTFACGFSEQAAALFSEFPPLEEMLEKESGGFVLDQLFLGQLKKIYEEHRVPEIEPGGRETALVCAEVAGEVFGLDRETVYSYESWQRSLRERVEDVVLPLQEGNERPKLLEMLLKQAKTLTSRQARAILAARLITGASKRQEAPPQAAGLAVLPEAFLAGFYLAAAKLVVD